MNPLKRWVMTVFMVGGMVSCLFANKPVELDLITKDNRVPTSLFESRSAVIISSIDRDNWQEKAQHIHKQLIRMKTDPVMYVYYQDLKSSAFVFEKYKEMFSSRVIRQVLLFDLDKPSTELAIIPLGPEGSFDFKGRSWHHSATNINDVLLTLALQIKRLDIDNANFLVPELPEIVDDIKIFEGKAYLNYPTRLTRATLAVALFPMLDLHTVSDTVSANEYNRKVAADNEKLREAFRDYPFPYEFVEDAPDEELYRNKYQYVLRILNTSGKTVKQLLNYEIEETETNYVSMIPLPDGTRTMKTLDADQLVFKCYIQQTVRSDVHVGRYWDADTQLGQAVTNFLLHLQKNVQ